MRTPSLRSMVPILMVAALLAAPPARAAGWLSSPFEGIWARLSALWAETGCVIDPNGVCRDEAEQREGIIANTGCVIDPDGRCRDQAGPAEGITSNTGGVIDPNRPRRP